MMGVLLHPDSLRYLWYEYKYCIIVWWFDFLPSGTVSENIETPVDKITRLLDFISSFDMFPKLVWLPLKEKAVTLCITSIEAQVRFYDFIVFRVKNSTVHQCSERALFRTCVEYIIRFCNSILL